MSSQISSHMSKRSSNSTPSTQRTWTAAEEQTLIDGLKELCVNGWRGDNGTFRPGYLKELECYLRKHHPNSGLKGEPHALAKIRYWKKCYASIAMLKSRSGLGFQYSDGAIIVDDPKFWDDFLKVDPNAKNMNTEKWPMFVDWEEIFDKDRATGEFAEGPLDAVEEIQRSQSFEPEKAGSQQTNKQGECTKRSFNVNEKMKCKKRKKIPENDYETFLKGMVEVIKNFTESRDKRLGALIDKIGNRDQSHLRNQIYSIIKSPIFELYSTEQRIKATLVLCDDVNKMELFIRMGELERQTMMSMIINGKL